jgi:hypothetical protein
MALCIGAILPGAAVAQTANDLVGTWKSVSNISIRPDGSKVDIFGPKATGITIFASNGRFALVNVNLETPKFASNNRTQGTPEENKAAFLGSIGLFGTYSVADKVITFNVEGSTYPNWTGTEQKRTVKYFNKDEIVWSLPNADFAWQRLK